MHGSQPGTLTIFLISFGGPGDVHPMVAMGQALRKRHHRVIFISNPYYEELARRLDLEFTGFGSAQHLIHTMQDSTRKSCGNGHTRVVSGRWLVQGLDRWQRRSRGVLGTMRSLYEEIEKKYIPGETILVARGNAFGACIAREKLGIPLATVHLQPAMFRSEYDAPGLPVPSGNGFWLRMARRSTWAAIDLYADRLLLPETNRFRAELGLPHVRRLFSKWIHSPDLVLGLFPDWFAPPQPDWPPATHLVGFPLFDMREISAIPREFEMFMHDGEPPVVFTAGSFHRNSKAFFEACVSVSLQLGIRGLLLSNSPGCIPANLPERVLHLPYVPLSAVLHRSPAIVHHGGIGTTGLALAAGTPQLLVPLADDQSDNAARIEKLGAGIHLSLAAFRREGASQLKKLMASQPIANVCRNLASRMTSQNPLDEAIYLIEELRAPVIKTAHPLN